MFYFLIFHVYVFAKFYYFLRYLGFYCNLLIKKPYSKVVPIFYL